MRVSNKKHSKNANLLHAYFAGRETVYSCVKQPNHGSSKREQKVSIQIVILSAHPILPLLFLISCPHFPQHFIKMLSYLFVMFLTDPHPTPTLKWNSKRLCFHIVIGNTPTLLPNVSCAVPGLSWHVSLMLLTDIQTDEQTHGGWKRYFRCYRR